MKEITTTSAQPAIHNISADVFKSWYSFIDGTERTKETYTKNIAHFSRFLTMNGITHPTKADIIQYKNALETNHKATTVQGYLMAVKQFFKWTEENGIYPNIAKNVKGESLARGFKKDYLTSAQVGRILGAIDRSNLKGKRDYAMISLMVTTGLRTIEVARANIEDMRTVADFTALFIQGKGKAEKSQYVKIECHAEEAIREYLAARGHLEDGVPLFGSSSNRNGGERMTTRSISRICKEHFRKIGLDSSRITAHSLRHTAATLNLLNGGTPEETMQLLRHANLNTTLIYSHALERAKNKSEARIGAAIFGA